MVRLSPKTELRDALNVLAADRREIELTLKTPRPLRKPTNSAQRKQMDQLRAAARTQISQQLDARARRAFRGHIAVELRLALPAGRHGAGLGPVVKDYLDLLRGPVVPDDAQVDHLLVLREQSTDTGATVGVRCLPLSIFAAEYDRAFRVIGEGGARALGARDPRSPGTDDPEPRAIDAVPVSPRTWGLSHFDPYSRELLAYEEGVLEILDELDAQEEEQLAEDPDAFVDLDVPSSHPEFEDWQVRARTRAYLEESIAYARGDWLSDQGFDARDRPGPRPEWLAETVERDAADVLHLTDEGPGCLVLAAPPERETQPGNPRWPQVVAREFALRRSTGRWWRARFRGPLVLDIALRGAAGRRNDVDNVARIVLGAVEKVFAEADLEMAGYRVYRQRAPVSDVRVRLMPAARLEALARSMDSARDIVRSERAERARN